MQWYHYQNSPQDFIIFFQPSFYRDQIKQPHPDSMLLLSHLVNLLVIFWYLDHYYYLDLSHLLFKLEEVLFEYSESLRKLIQAKSSYRKEYCLFFFFFLFFTIFPQKKRLSRQWKFLYSSDRHFYFFADQACLHETF